MNPINRNVMEWPEDLLELFEDPMLADVKPAAPRLTANDRLVQSLHEVSEWVRSNGRLPNQQGDFNEKRLFRTLQALRKNAEELKPYDHLNILEE
jgi:hypothetical protein